MYEDELGYKKGEVQKRKIVESEEFSVDERISIISEIYAIVKKEEPDITWRYRTQVHIPDPGSNLTGLKCDVGVQYNQKF